MEHPTRVNHINQELIDILSGATALLCSRSFYAAAFRIPFIVLRSRRIEQQALAITRDVFDTCSYVCDTGACAGNLYTVVKSTRDNLMRLDEKLTGLPFPFTLYRSWVDKSLTEWDDLAEDCLISSDKDIRAELNRIAALC